MGAPADFPLYLQPFSQASSSTLRSAGQQASRRLGRRVVASGRRLHAMQVELAAAAGNFPLHSRAEIVDVELCDLPWILSGLDVDVPELHGHARLLPLGICPRRAEAAPAAAAWQHEQRNNRHSPD